MDNAILGEGFLFGRAYAFAEREHYQEQLKYEKLFRELELRNAYRQSQEAGDALAKEQAGADTQTAWKLQRGPLPERACECCGGDYVPTDGNQVKYCGKVCARKARLAWRRKHEKRTPADTTPIPRVCRCGITFHTRKGNIRHCGEKCRHDAICESKRGTNRRARERRAKGN